VVDRLLNAAGSALAVLMPLALGLAVALLTPVPVVAVLVLWGGWLLALGVIAVLLLRPVRVPTKRGLR
jgi:hypothetical protein